MSTVLNGVKNYLAAIIGQDSIKLHLNRMIDGIAKKRASFPLCPIELTGWAGLGKTYLAKLLGKILTEVTGGEFSFVEIPSSVTLPGFMTIWSNFIQNKRVVIFIDEAHGLQNMKVKNLLKRILETDNQVKEITHEEFNLTANPFDQCWIFATNEEPSDTALFGPTSRTKQLQLMPLTRKESIELIMKRAARYKISVNAPAAEYLVDRVIPNPRAIKELIDTDALYFGKNLTLENAKQLVLETKRFPMGLRKGDIQTLIFLGKDEKGKQVQEIAANAGGEDSKTTRYRLTWLAGLGLIRTAGNGRKVLTQAGMDYLVKLKNDKQKGIDAKALANATAETPAPKPVVAVVAKGKGK